MKYNVPVQSLIDHIKTALDVDPWAKEMVEELLKEKEDLGIELTNAIELIHKKNERIEKLLKKQDAQDATDIRDIDGLWCDDITFCQEQCGWKSCPRNKQNIRDRTIPHSFSVEIPQDCPKRQEGRGEANA